MKKRFPDKTPYEIDEENNNTQSNNTTNITDYTIHNVFGKKI